MATSKKNRLVIVLTIAVLIFAGGGVVYQALARKMSEQAKSGQAGFNGGFEYFINALPANWIMYTPGTVPDADFDIAADRAERHEGQQSLLFKVRRCSDRNGWHAPGFATEIPAAPGADYEIRLWAKSEQATFVVTTAAITAMKDANRQHRLISPTKTEWQEYIFHCHIPQNMNQLRLELNVTSPGKLWVDDVRITKAPAGPR